MIKKNCDNWNRLWWLKKIVIIEKDCKKKDEFSSNINKGIRAVLFFTKRFHTHTQKAQNANKRLSLRCFLCAYKV